MNIANTQSPSAQRVRQFATADELNAARNAAREFDVPTWRQTMLLHIRAGSERKAQKMARRFH